MRVSSTGGELKWKEDASFDLRNHLAHDEASPQTVSEFFHRISAHFERGVDCEKPPWKAVVLTNAERTGAPAAALLFMVHHALADGIGGFELLSQLAAEKAERRSEKDTVEAPQRKEKTPLRALAGIARDLLQQSLKGPLNGSNSAARRITGMEVSLSELRKMKSALGVTLNDLYLALISDTIRRYFDFVSHPPCKTRIIMPVSTRLRSMKRDLGNHLTAVGVNLPVQLRDPVAAARALSTSLKRLHSNGAVRAYALLARMLSLLPDRPQRRFAEFFAKRTSFICTNLPDSARPRVIAGAKVIANYGVPALMSGHGVAFSFVTYAQRAFLSVVTDPQIVPDSSVLLRFFHEACTEMKAALEEI